VNSKNFKPGDILAFEAIKVNEFTSADQLYFILEKRDDKYIIVNGLFTRTWSTRSIMDTMKKVSNVRAIGIEKLKYLTIQAALSNIYNDL